MTSTNNERLREEDDLYRYWIDEESPYIEVDVVIDLLKAARSQAFEDAYRLISETENIPYITDRRKHMLYAIKSGGFTTAYKYAKEQGISHQAAYQAYNLLAKKGLLEDSKHDK